MLNSRLPSLAQLSLTPTDVHADGGDLTASDLVALMGLADEAMLFKWGQTFTQADEAVLQGQLVQHQADLDPQTAERLGKLLARQQSDWTRMDILRVAQWADVAMLSKWVGALDRADVETLTDRLFDQMEQFAHLVYVRLNRELANAFAALPVTGFDGNTFVRAAQENNVQVMQQQLAFPGADVNVFDEEIGWTALMAAAYNGRRDAAELLLNAGADFNLRDPQQGRSAFELAVEEGRHRIVKLLLDAGADANSVDAATNAPVLVVAAERGWPRVVRYLLFAGANPGAASNAALMSAICVGHTGIVQQLLSAGVDVNTRGRYGATPLTTAAECDSVEILLLLLLTDLMDL